MIAVGILALLPSRSSAGANPPGLGWYYGSNEQYFFPGVAGMSNQTTYAEYYLQNPSNVTITVLDSNGNVVKTIENAVSTPPCNYECSLSWDGTNDEGQTVSPGQYTIQVVATNSVGTGTIDTLRDVADPGAPGSLTTPSNGATLEGVVAFVFTQSPSFPSGYAITQVNVPCIGASYSPSADGAWEGSGDTSQCGNGSETLTDSVYFTDPLGNSQSWTDPNPPTVTIGNPPGLGWYYGSNEQYFFPGVAGMSNQTTYAEYYLQNPSNVTITVLDSNGNVVKTIENAVSTPPCNYECSLSWDGTNDEGQTVSPGQYTIQVVATNSVGTGTIDTLRDVADPGAPGSLTTPSNGATLEGVVAFVFTQSPSFPSGYAITQVNVPCIGASYSPSADGAWEGSGDTSQCGNGSETLTDSVYFTDPLGNSQSWTDPNPPTVTIGNPPGLGWYYGSNEQYFFPGVAGMSNQTTYAEYYLQNPSNVTITVLDSNGNVVKTIENAVSTPPCNYECSLSWDGTNDEGQTVSPGQYTIQVVATNSVGTGTIDTLRDVADPGAPGSLTTPSNGATLEGVVAFVFDQNPSYSLPGRRPTYPPPPPGYTITEVNVPCIGDATAPAGGSAVPGTWEGSGDTSQCGNGSETLTDSVYFTDPLGNSQSWTDPNPPTVTIGNPPGLGWYYGSNEQYFFPGVAGMSNQTTYAEYYLQNPSNVTITVLDSNGNVVKTIENAVSTPPCNYECSLSWDGTNDEGQTVSPGQYTIQVVATNSVGTGTIDTLRDVADPGAPGSLTTPATDSTLEGLAQFEFVPNSSFFSGTAITQIGACLSTGGCAEMYNTSPDGSWRTTELTGSLTPGQATLAATVYFTDPLGVGQSWTDSGRTVFVNTTAVPLQVTASPASGLAPLDTDVTVTASDPNDLTLQYSIDFGDGSSVATGSITYPYTAISLPHTFTSPGLYVVSVGVSDGASGSAQQSINVKVGSPTLPVELSPSPSSGTAPLNTSFTLTTSDPTGDPVNYDLAFGDGQATSGTI